MTTGWRCAETSPVPCPLSSGFFPAHEVVTIPPLLFLPVEKFFLSVAGCFE